jgi:NADPH:quinone reductase-like Zn-dependent oxidoreductase
MRALRIHAHGGAEALVLDDLPRPTPAAGELLVKMVAASVNPIDWKMREGLVRVDLPRVLGRDGAGWDESSGVRTLGVGAATRDGTHAEYAIIAREASAAVPDEVSFEEAAALGIAGLSAWIPLAENANVSAGQRVLIHAGAGGVGSLAIQIASLRGAEVWTTCSADNADWCRALGAYRAIDYTREDFAAVGPIFDAVLDTVGGDVHRRSGEVLKPGGALTFLNAAPTQPSARQDIRVLPTLVRATGERLAALLQLAAKKQLRVPIEARFALERAVEAYELSRSGHARGKIVLQVS